MEPRVAGDITLCGNSMPSSDGGYVAGRSAGYENKAFIMKYDDLDAVTLGLILWKLECLSRSFSKI